MELFLTFQCKKFRFGNFRILDMGFSFGLCLESEQHLIKGALHNFHDIGGAFRSSGSGVDTMRFFSGF